MKHLGTKRIETDRLVLRAFTFEDAHAIYNHWAKDPDVTKYLTWPHHASLEITQNVLTDWISHYPENDFYLWAIVLKNNNQPIGSISVVQKNDQAEMVHIGYCIGKPWWNKGITSEALAALIKFFFTEVEVNRIESRHDPRNPNSGKAMMKCGLEFEGTHKECDWNNQGICDASYYAILKKDYTSERNSTHQK